MSQKLEQLARDEAFMARALALAERGTGWTSPNPLVGAVIVKDGRIIGEGWHTGHGGQPHAEREALAACDENPARKHPVRHTGAVLPLGQNATLHRRYPGSGHCPRRRGRP